MLEHLIDFIPPVAAHAARGTMPLDRAEPDETLNAQVKTTEWLERLGIVDDNATLKEADANAARKVFSVLAGTAPAAEAKTQLTQLKTPEAVRHLVTMLSAYDWEFVEMAKELRGMAVAKILEETNHPDARIRLKALDMLGKVTEVGLFTERIEVKKTELPDAEIDKKIKDKLAKFMGVIDANVTNVSERSPTTIDNETQRPESD